MHRSGVKQLSDRAGRTNRAPVKDPGTFSELRSSAEIEDEIEENQDEHSDSSNEDNQSEDAPIDLKNVKRAVDIVKCDMEEVDTKDLKGSAWGATIALIQLARSSQFEFHFLNMAIRHMGRNICAFVLQVMLLNYFALALVTFRQYAGQPHVCNFGSHFSSRCPGGPNCIGPSGTPFTYSSINSDFNSYSTRVFMKNSLLDIFRGNADMTQKIQDTVQPGEYGLESHGCRYVCMFILTVMIYTEWKQSFDMISLLLAVPSRDEQWLVHDGHKGDGSLDDVSFRVCGISRHWKAFYFIALVFPRFFVAVWSFMVGMAYLMWTAGIEDLVMNSLAITFILSIDDIFFEAWTSPFTKRMMEKLEPFTRRRSPSALNKYVFFHWMVPFHMVTSFIIAFAAYRVSLYRWCDLTADGSWVSKAVYPMQPTWPFDATVIWGMMFNQFKTTAPNATWCSPPELNVDKPCQLR